MKLPDPESSVRDQDNQLRELIRQEVKALLNQQKDLDRLEKTSAIKEKLMRVSHEIRNPLTTIQAVCSTLMLETEDPDQRERLQKINTLVDQLAQTLASAVAQGQDPEDTATRIDLGELARSLVNLLQYQACNDIHIHLHLAQDLDCNLPVRALSRSLYQLLSNALEATRDREQGELRLECCINADQVEIHVLDNGPGLPPQLLELGLRTYGAAHPGTVLGLSSVERFATGLGGRLELKNRETGGAWVSLLLPAEHHQ
jgi:signal transduction histidine kinase